MRTTLTLEPDVAQTVERLRRESGRSLKYVINELIRRGAMVNPRGARHHPPPGGYTIPVSGVELLLPEEGYRSTSALLAPLEDEELHSFVERSETR